MAEREGFEPPIGLHLCRISSAVHSTTLPPLLKAPCRSRAPVVGGVNRRGWRARQGAKGENPLPVSPLAPASRHEREGKVVRIAGLRRFVGRIGVSIARQSFCLGGGNCKGASDDLGQRGKMPLAIPARRDPLPGPPPQAGGGAAPVGRRPDSEHAWKKRGGTARRGKHWRSRCRSLKFWLGRAASPASWKRRFDPSVRRARRNAIRSLT